MKCVKCGHGAKYVLVHQSGLTGCGVPMRLRNGICLCSDPIIFGDTEGHEVR